MTVYLDNAASTRPHPEVTAAMLEMLRDDWGNPSSGHRVGQKARARVELARESVARLIGAAPGEIIFTCGGTESAQLAVAGTVESRAQDGRDVLVISAIEHSVVKETAERAEQSGTEVVRLPCDARGVVQVEALEAELAARADRIALVSVMWVNNETGVIQPIERIGALCRDHGVLFHTDATQRAGKAPTDVSATPVDMLTLSGHKFHGPKGAGALYVRGDLRPAKQMIGGPQERNRRGGTENAAGIVGLGVAADLARTWLAGDGCSRQAALHESFEAALRDLVPGAVIHGADTSRMWTITNIAFPGSETEPLLMVLSERGLCASGGAACASGSLKTSSVLAAMHVPDELARGSARFSICQETTGEEIAEAVKIIEGTLGAIRVG